MSISKRVAEALDKMNSGDPEAALFQICSAVDATASALYQRPGKASYKEFIHDNFDLITRIALGPRILNLNVGYDLNKNLAPGQPPIKPVSPGYFSIEQVFYHAVRCGLYHESRLPPGLVFGEEQVISVIDGNLTLPASLVNGLTYCVVLCPVNSAERIGDNYGLSIGGWTVAVNMLWGKQAEFRALAAAMDAIVG